MRQYAVLACFMCLLVFLAQPPLVHATVKPNNPVSADYSDVGEPLSRIFNAKQHGGHNQNWTSIQSQNGFIYVGHTTGISQWDGATWTNLPTPHLTPVRSISEWQGDLYLGTTDELLKLSLNTAGELAYQSLSEESEFAELAFGEIWGTAANQSGVLFSATDHTFFYDGTSIRIIEQAVPSKHFVFSVNDDFYYKPRDQAHVYKIQTKSQNGKLEFVHTQLTGVLPNSARVMEILSASDNILTLVTETHGIFQWQNGEFIQIKAPQDFGQNVQLYDAILSQDNHYYISSTYHGLFILDANWQLLRNYQDSDKIGMNSIFSVNEDKQGNIWLTGIPNVVRIRPPHVISEFRAGTSSTEILSLKRTDIGIFASGNGVFKLQTPASPIDTPSFVVMSDNLNASVDLIEHQGSLIKPGWGGIYELRLDPSGSKIALENKIADVALGRVIASTPNANQFVVSSSDGAFLISFENKGWRVQPFNNAKDQLISLNLDNQNTLWLGTDQGKVYKIENALNAGADARAHIFDEADGLGLGPVSLFDIDGRTLISSAGKLLVEGADGLQVLDDSSRQAFSMFSADWLANINSLDKMTQTPASGSASERIWYRKNGKSAFFEKLDSGEWQNNTSIFDAVESGGFYDLFVSPEDILWFVRDKAEIYRVNMSLATQIPPLAPINMRSLSHQNTPISFLGARDAINIQANQQNLRASFASTDSSSPRPLEYRTRLLYGNDDAQWSNWSEETYRDFTLVSAGNYRFEVQAKDAWSRVSTTQLKLYAIAPWYLSTAAYTAYIIIAALLILLFAWSVQKWRTAALQAQNQALELKVEARTHEVNEKIEQLRQQQILKDRFFGNVSHEFRTPLTLTIGPLEVLIAEHKAELSDSVKYLANTALNNASKMLALVGQVLDLNRLEAGKLPLRITQHDIAELLRKVSERFMAWAQQHQQVIEVHGCDEPLLLWFDIDQIDKCISNLLSNAIKYSGQNTVISVSLLHTQDEAKVLVSDNGVGISPHAQQKVFERFYQDKSSEQVAAPGTGIGLALVREIMELHHGFAELVEQSSVGCCFALRLKTGVSHFDQAQIIEPIQVPRAIALPRDGLHRDSQELVDPASADDELDISTLLSDDSQDVTTLLVVDDNKELLNFISLRLSASYRILQANDGREGLAIAKEALPDLIISDVNMPQMTGLELAQALKQDKQTRTIPIILLTAKATKREIVEGFSVGADDYLTKPFDTSELIVRVNAQINSRKLIREGMQASASASREQANNSKSSFAVKVDGFIQSQLSEPDFKVEKLAQAMFMSRDTLTRKCKKEFNETPLNLIVNARMLRAENLLKQNSMSVSEVAYACGFESLAYFSKSFKKHTGSNPSQLID